MQNFSIYFVAFDKQKNSVSVKMQSFAYSTFHCISIYAVFSWNSAFGNAEFQNTVSTERTRKFLRKNNLELKYINANYIFSSALKSRYIAHRS